MAEKDVVYSKINIIKNCLMAIERATAEISQTEFRQGIYELNLQRAIQACIDIANVVIAKEGLGLPNSYGQSFSILNDHQVIDSKMADLMRKMVGFRNISVHEYGTVNPDIVHTIVQENISDFESFYKVIYDRVNKSW